MSEKLLRYVPIVLIIILGFVIYANPLSDAYFIDDQSMVLDTKVQSVTAFTLAMDRYFWGINPKAFHLSNVVIHLMSSWIVYAILLTLFGRAGLALAGSLFFATHPIHLPAVGYISARGDLLGMLFILLAVLGSILYRKKHKAGYLLLIVFGFGLSLSTQDGNANYGLRILPETFVSTIIKLTGLIIFAGAAWLLLKRKKSAQALFWMTMLLVVSFNTLTLFRQRQVWQNPKEFYQRVLEASPDNYQAYIELGKIFFQEGREGEGLRQLKEGVRLNPNYAQGYYHLAIAYEKIGDKKSAAKSLESAVRIKSDYVLAWYYLGHFYNDFNQKDKAIFAYQQVIKYDPGHFNAYRQLANVFNSVGRTTEAQQYLQKSFELDPNAGQILTNQGVQFKKQGKIQEAIIYYKKAIELDKTFADAYVNLAALYNEINRRQEALALCQNALEINPRHMVGLFNLAVIYQGLGQYEEAIRAYKKLLEITPQNIQVHANLAALYYEVKQYDKAISVYDFAKQRKHVFPESFEQAIELRR